jgi:NADPH:quinone reductase-like Zn-dependent oxidoreductase
MKAMRLAAPGGLDRLALVDIADPGAPGPGQLRVRLHATSLNYHDYSVVLGRMPTADGRIPMADGAGVVEAVGEGVGDFAVGDHVVSCFFPFWQDGAPTDGDFSRVPGDGLDGHACELVVRAASGFTKAPEGWSHAEAATLTTAGLTAWRALVEDGGLKPGDWVLCLGTGGVSIFALQLARAAGARAIVTSSSDQKLAHAMELGATAVVNYRSDPDWGESVRRLTGGAGVDHVVELGGPGTLAQSFKAVKIGGQVHLIGTMTGGSGEVPTAAMMIKQVRLQGLVVGSRRQQRDMVRGLEASGVRPVIDRTFALEDLAEAFRYQASAAHLGKISVTF